jgi:hypothetical protein
MAHSSEVGLAPRGHAHEQHQHILPPSIATDHASVDHTVDPAQAVAHLTPERWARQPAPLTGLGLDPNDVLARAGFGFLRFLAAALDEEGAIGEAAFWTVVGACVAGYQRANPRLAGRFEAYDLFAKRFPLSCLNRLQPRGDRQTADPENPANVLQLAGTLENPIAKHRPRIRAGKDSGRAPVG